MALSAAKEKNTYIIKASFFDEAGSAMTPTTLTWSLRDNSGAIVNNRSAVSAIVSSVLTVVLTGDDLAYVSSSSTMRTFIVEGTYSSTYGSGLLLKDEVTFGITNLKGVE